MLEVVVFLCGAVVMVIELAATRVLAPFLGTSTIVWTSVIGIILGALAMGYSWGGRLADRHPSARALAWIILAAAVATGLVGFTRSFVVEMIRASGGGLHAGSMLSVIVLFAPSAVLLGMVSPFAARIRLTDGSRAGETVGRLYALSTMGSIAGTFAGGFFLISFFGCTTILFLMAGVLCLASLACHAEKWGAKAVLGAVFMALSASFTAEAKTLDSGVLDVDTDYQRVMVYRTKQATGREMLAMSTGPEGVQGAVYPDEPEALALNYTRYLTLASHFRPDMRRVLVLGGGAYAFPKYVLRNHPGATVDVVELDPGITRLARDHFFLPDDPRIRILHQDARTFLNANQARYDVIIVDVFNSSASIPFHLTTLETARRLSLALEPGGVMLVNTIVALEGPRAELYKSFHATYSRAFARVEAVRCRPDGRPQDTQNVLFTCFGDDTPRQWTSQDPDMQAKLALRLPEPGLEGALVLTDEYAPVERFMTGW